MHSLPVRLAGPVLLEPVVYGDERGFFFESYRRSALVEHGVDLEFVQDNHSRSRQGIVRGMHYQAGMAKLIRCVQGSIFDVLVDMRRGSPTFGQWEGFELDDSNHHLLFSPDGFGHGFCVVSQSADIVYKCSTYYDPELEGGFAYDDPDVAIDWPARFELVGSARDRRAPRLADLEASLPAAYSA
jgi:dTDP-4-dehydrorhamnose 3,5-epimerase